MAGGSQAAYNGDVPSRKAKATKSPPELPTRRPVTEEDLDELDNLLIDQRLLTEKPIPLEQVLKGYARRPRVVGR